MFDMSVFNTPVPDETYNKLKRAVKRMTDGSVNRHATRLDETLFSTDEMTCIAAVVHDKPGAQLYGYMDLFYEYKKHIFKIWWRIHTPNMGHANLANSPINIQEVVWVKDKKLPDVEYWTMDETTFGVEAFWLYTSCDSLSGSDLYVRLAFNKIKAWSVKEQMCKKLRKTDKLHLRLKAEKQGI